MNAIEVGCTLHYEVDTPASFLFQIAAANNSYQHIIDESFTVSPFIPMEACDVSRLGNRMHRLLAQPGSLEVHYQASVESNQRWVSTEHLDEISHAELPAEVLTMLNPSRYCESDRLTQYAWREFGAVNPGYGRVQYIVEWVNRHLNYVPGSTGPTTTACDVLLQRTGVCRDFAHLAITFCRAIGIPARYAAGYAVDLQPPDFHGFFEAYLGGGWFLFDATKLAPVSGFVRIGAGRDAADLSFATSVGAVLPGMMDVWAHYEDFGATRPVPAPNKAVSSA